MYADSVQKTSTESAYVANACVMHVLTGKSGDASTTQAQMQALLKEWSMLSVRISSSGCTREVAKHERSVRVTRGVAECDFSFLSA